MKKNLIIIATMLLFVFSATACSPSSVPSKTATTQTKAAAVEDSDGETLCSLNGYVVLQEDGITVTADRISCDERTLSIYFRVNNESDHDIMIDVASGTTVNGYQIPFNGSATVEVGATDALLFGIAGNELLELIGVHRVSDIRSLRPIFRVFTNENGMLKDERYYVGNEIPVFSDASVHEVTGTLIYNDKNIQLYYLDFIPDYQEKYSVARFLAVNNNGIDEKLSVSIHPPTINGKESLYDCYAGDGEDVIGGGKAFHYVFFSKAEMEKVGISEIENVELIISLNRITDISSIENVKVPFQIVP